MGVFNAQKWVKKRCAGIQGLVKLWSKPNINIMKNMLTIADLQRLLDSRPLPDFFKDWITESQLMQLIGISANTLRNKRSKNQITYTTVCGKFFLYYLPEIIAEMTGNIVRKA